MTPLVTPPPATPPPATPSPATSPPVTPPPATPPPVSPSPATPSQVTFSNDASRIAIQAARLTIHGNQYNYIARSEPAVHDATQPSRYVSVPLKIASTYTERHNLLQELEGKLGKPYCGEGLAHAVAVVGLGGTGKTQLVLRYIKEHGKQYDTILWLDARSEETARASFERFRSVLPLPSDAPISGMSLVNAPAVQAVLRWLHSRTPEQSWLVVIDNADTLSKTVSSIIPHGPAGSIVVTSQDSEVSRALLGISEEVKVESMSSDEAMSLLHKAINKEGSENSGSFALASQRLVDRLDKLPFAIDLAGARISMDVREENDVEAAMDRYLTELDRYRDSLRQNEDFAEATSYGKTVWNVWQASLTSIKRIEKSQAGAFPLQLLTLMTKLNRSGIEDELFRLASLGLQETCVEMGRSAPPWMQTVLSLGDDGNWDDHHYRVAIKSLRRYGLVRPIKGLWTGSTMHSLVRWRASYEANDEEMWDWYSVFITAASLQLSQETGNVQFRRYLIVHLPPNRRILAEDKPVVKEKASWRRKGFRRIWKSAGAKTNVKDNSWQWEVIGKIWKEEGRWTESAELFAAAYRWRLSMLGRQHRSTLIAMAYLALTYWSQGRWKEAEELEVKVLEATSRTLGEEHPNTLTSIANLASIYWNQGRWKEAEELGVKVLEATSRTLGEEHPNTLTSIANLASTYWNQGRWKEAEKLGVKVIEARSRTLGEEHPDTLTSMANLASTYRHQGRWKEAEELGVKVLEARSRTLGEEHPDTLTSMAILASTYRHQGRWKEAEELEVKVLEATSRTLGEEHPDTLSSTANLASTYRHQGRWKEAEELEVKVLEARSRTLGEEHPDTLTSMANLATTYWDQGRWREAEELEVKVIEARSRRLGEEHPDTLTSMANLASTYWNQGRWKEAEELDVKVIEATSRRLGEEHPDTLTSTANLATTYWNQGRWKEAEELEVKVIEARSRRLGEEHPDTLTSMANLASTYWDQGRWKEAEELLLRAADGRMRVLGPDHPDTLAVVSKLQQLEQERALSRPTDITDAAE